MAGNLDIDIDLNGLPDDITTHLKGINAKVLRFTVAVQNRVQEAAQAHAPERGDFRRGPVRGAPGNLKRATNRLPPVREGATIEARIKVDEDEAPYAKWVVGGSGRKTAKSAKGMIFPETRWGISPGFMWGPFRSVAGNPKQDYLGEGLAEVRMSAWLMGREKMLQQSVGTIRRGT